MSTCKIEFVGKIFRVTKEVYSYDYIENIHALINPPTIRDIPVNENLMVLGCAKNFYREDIVKQYENYYNSPYCFLFLYGKIKVILGKEFVSEEAFQEHFVKNTL